MRRVRNGESDPVLYRRRSGIQKGSGACKVHSGKGVVIAQDRGDCVGEDVGCPLIVVGIHVTVKFLNRLQEGKLHKMAKRPLKPSLLNDFNGFFLLEGVSPVFLFKL